MKNSEEKNKKERITSNLSPFFDEILKSLNPSQWTLKTRLFYLPGFLIAFFNILLLFYLNQAYFVQTEHSANNQLSLVSKWIDHEINHHSQLLLTEASVLTTDPVILEALADKDRTRLKNQTLIYLEKMQKNRDHTNNLSLHFYLPPAESFFQTRYLNKWGDDLSDSKPMVLKVNQELRAYAALEASEQVISLVAVAPILFENEYLGALEIRLDLDDLLEGMQIASPFGIILLANEDLPDIMQHGKDQNERPLILKSHGYIDPETKNKLISSGGKILNDSDKEHTYHITHLYDYQNLSLGKLIIVYNVLSEKQIYHKDIFVFLLILGSVLLIILLYYNLTKITLFLSQLKKILIGSHFNDFTERFESDHIHCLNILNCKNLECPVFQDPSLVCYLETGSQAISPKWRNTCIFLNKYKDCIYCPVYSERIRDELIEMRNVVNTTMRLWSDFLDRIGGLLSEVLRTSRYHRQKMSLDNVAVFMEQMAKVTNFSHNLQGVRDEEELFQQLVYIFEHEFNLDYYLLLEVNKKENNMKVVAENRGTDPLCLNEVSINADLCRAKRVAESVCSSASPILCPYFNIDHDEYHRYCLPIVMGGSVGSVFSFVAPKKQLDIRKKQILLMLKYLNESAPVLSSFRLLKLSKEQSLRDPLTKCNNRRFLDEYIEQYEPLAIRKNRKIGFLMADIDFFKLVNDEHGHQAGDQILKQVAAVIRGQIRESDLLIRYGGEEFLIVLMESEPDATEEVAEKIRSAVDQHRFTLPDGVITHKTMSVGVADFPKDGESMFQVIKFADVALYEAKESGRNKVIRFNVEMWKNVEE
ncbi:MAG: diguanylate cyclase [Desulfobulbaceae bacterium]|nr:diguanylate cyclase [Desulfobulbaceae bacterium]